MASTVSTPDRAEPAWKAGAGHVETTPTRRGERDHGRGGPGDRIVEVALGANLQLDLAISRPGTVVACYAAEVSDPVLPSGPA